jgi:phage shock protein PspC (stress-responsive transcriptional regulator)
MASAQLKRHAEGMNTTAPESDQRTDPTEKRTGNGSETRPLYRPVHDRMLAGVASGLARYFGVDVLLVRIALLVLVFVGGIGLAIYLASWLLIPEEGTDQSILAEFTKSMQGWRD